MMPKMKATLDEEIREATRKLFLSSSVADLCKNEATPKQEEFLLHVFQAELAAREKNKRHRLMKRAGFPTYKTFEGYEYGHIQFPPLFSLDELESCQFFRERKSLILTTNLEFSKRGSVFTDEQMAAAMIDRLAHHGHLLMAGGRSYRMEHALMRQDAVVEPAS